MGGKQSKDQAPAAPRPPITKLPDYFPTYEPQCAVVAKTFFTCFESNARILKPEDVPRGKNALATCQDELVAYAACMEKHHSRENKNWWNRT
jgi:hypothetical protein